MRLLRGIAWVTIVVCVATPASGRAGLIADPDNEIAKRHYDTGAARYEQKDYLGAVEEFELALRIKRIPELDYNIARCRDRLEQAALAIEAYERYLAARPDAAEAHEIAERIAVLRARLTTDARARRRLYVAPSVLAGGAVLLAAIGTGLVVSVKGDLASLDQKWLAMPTSALQGEARALEARATAGYAMWGVAGAVAMVDVALWIVATRRHKERR